MITRDGAYCDNCSHSEGEFGHTFRYTLSLIKRRGWKVIKRNDEYLHHCPDCVGNGGAHPPIETPDTATTYWWED